MKILIKTIAVLSAIIILFSSSACKKSDNKESYEKENAGTTGYGAIVKSSLYIDDFYFLTVGTVKSKVELLLGNAHYCKNNDEVYPVYSLGNGDSIEITYDDEEMDIIKADYIYSDGTTANFFDILVDLGILKSNFQESNGESTTVIPSGNDKPDSTDTPSDNKPDVNDNPTQTPIPNDSHTAVQGDYFASGMYNLTLVEASISLDMQRSDVLALVGKPNYYFSHNFSKDSYIIDCYNLNDGSKLYLDYGYTRDTLRCATVYKSGSYKNLLGNWSTQSKPTGFTHKLTDKNKINHISKNMNPVTVYKSLGEPSWYEGTRGSYSDVYVLNDGSFLYLNFGSAHNKLTSASIQGVDGSNTVITLN